MLTKIRIETSPNMYWPRKKGAEFICRLIIRGDDGVPQHRDLYEYAELFGQGFLVVEGPEDSDYQTFSLSYVQDPIRTFEGMLNYATGVAFVYLVFAKLPKGDVWAQRWSKAVRRGLRKRWMQIQEIELMLGLDS